MTDYADLLFRWRNPSGDWHERAAATAQMIAAGVQLCEMMSKVNFDAVEMKFGRFFKKQYWLQRDGAHDAVRHHVHDSDHVTALALGSIEVWLDGRLVETRHAPTFIDVPAGTRHEFRAITPQALLYCLHMLEEGQERPSHEEG